MKKRDIKTKQTFNETDFSVNPFNVVDAEVL